MIRLALPKGRNLEPALEALARAECPLDGFDPGLLRQRLDAAGLEVLLLKDWDLPLYVEHGICDAGVVGSDVLEEQSPDLLVPLRLLAGRSRFSLIGRSPRVPRPGAQIRVASKYPLWSARLLEQYPWGAEVVTLHGSVELAPLLALADLACDIVQTGKTLRDHGLVEVERLAEVAPCVVLNRGSYQRLRAPLNALLQRLERAGAAA